MGGRAWEGMHIVASVKWRRDGGCILYIKCKVSFGGGSGARQ